jgi:hypothetical protein
VNIQIADNEQIGNIISLIKNKLESENKYTVELHRQLVTKELIERKYDSDVVDEWISFIE